MSTTSSFCNPQQQHGDIITLPPHFIDQLFSELSLQTCNFFLNSHFRPYNPEVTSPTNMDPTTNMDSTTKSLCTNLHKGICLTPEETEEVLQWGRNGLTSTNRFYPIDTNTQLTQRAQEHLCNLIIQHKLPNLEHIKVVLPWSEILWEGEQKRKAEGFGRGLMMLKKLTKLEIIGMDYIHVLFPTSSLLPPPTPIVVKDFIQKVIEDEMYKSWGEKGRVEKDACERLKDHQIRQLPKTILDVLPIHPTHRIQPSEKQCSINRIDEVSPLKREPEEQALQQQCQSPKTTQLSSSSTHFTLPSLSHLKLLYSHIGRPDLELEYLVRSTLSPQLESLDISFGSSHCDDWATKLHFFISWLAKMTLLTSLKLFQLRDSSFDLVECIKKSGSDGVTLFSRLHDFDLSRFSLQEEKLSSFLAYFQSPEGSLPNAPINNLTSLSLPPTATNSTITTLANSSSFRNLVNLTLFKCYLITDDGIKMLCDESCKMKSIQSLDFQEQIKLTDTTLHHLSTSPNLTNLKSLSITWAREVTVSSLGYLNESVHIRGLERITLAGSKFGIESQETLHKFTQFINSPTLFMPRLHSSSSLSTINLDGDVEKQYQIESQPVPPIPTLIHLDFRSSKLSKDAIIVISKSSNIANLRALYLDGSDIGSGGSKKSNGDDNHNDHNNNTHPLTLPSETCSYSLFNSQYLTNLTELSLAGCNLTDDDIHHLSNSPTLSNLKKLDLQFNSLLTPQSLWLLFSSPHLTQLTMVEVGNNTLQMLSTARMLFNNDHRGWCRGD